MALKYFLCVLLSYNMLLYCASAAVHGHSVDNLERESDGSYRARDYEHYGDSGHNSEFDHEAILGATEYFIAFIMWRSRRLAREILQQLAQLIRNAIAVGARRDVANERIVYYGAAGIGLYLLLLHRECAGGRGVRQTESRGGQAASGAAAAQDGPERRPGNRPEGTQKLGFEIVHVSFYRICLY